MHIRVLIVYFKKILILIASACQQETFYGVMMAMEHTCERQKNGWRQAPGLIIVVIKYCGRSYFKSFFQSFGVQAYKWRDVESKLSGAIRKNFQFWFEVLVAVEWCFTQLEDSNYVKFVFFKPEMSLKCFFFNFQISCKLCLALNSCADYDFVCLLWVGHFVIHYSSRKYSSGK